MSKLNANIMFTNTNFDAFDATEAETGQKRVIQSMVHIRNQQRNNRKSLTTIAGLAEDLDLTRILKFMRKMFSTNGTILHDEDGAEVLQLQGDRRREAADFLVKFKVCEKEDIKIHGA